MAKKSVDDYLQQGIHGAKETKPDERRRFLGTIRERVVVALTQAEVRRKQSTAEFRRILEENKQAQVYLNGNLNYSVLSNYIHLAEELSVAYKIVTNKEYNSKYGLVLAYDYAINKEDISFQKGKKPALAMASGNSKGIGSFFKSLFRKN